MTETAGALQKPQRRSCLRRYCVMDWASPSRQNAKDAAYVHAMAHHPNCFRTFSL
jgi:hypothetical protein